MDSLSKNTSEKSIFEELKKIHNGTECWDARELMPAAGYKTWRDFSATIVKAIDAAKLNNEPVEIHFLSTSSKNAGGKGRPGTNFLLTRTACYYIFQNGDATKPEIAGAQAYFIRQTRLQEISNQTRLDERRANLHNKVISSEEGLTTVAGMHHELKDPKRMHDAGSEGLYNMPVDDVEYHKGIEPGQLYDFIDSPELAAHYFRITQTEVQLENDAYDGYVYDQEGLESVAKGVGTSVRNVMRKRGKRLPEEMAAVEDIHPILERLGDRALSDYDNSETPAEVKTKPKRLPTDHNQLDLFVDEPTK